MLKILVKLSIKKIELPICPLRTYRVALLLPISLFKKFPRCYEIEIAPVLDSAKIRVTGDCS